MGIAVGIGRMTRSEFLDAIGFHREKATEHLREAERLEDEMDISFPRTTKSHTDNSPPKAGLDQAPMVQDDKAGER